MRIQFQVPDLACAHCARSLESALRNVPGVQTVMIALDFREVEVDCEDFVREEWVREAVHEVGYACTKVS